MVTRPDPAIKDGACGRDPVKMKLHFYSITSRRKWKCVGCHKQFSVTSGTIFASRKLAFVDLLAAICIFVNAVKGISAMHLSRALGCQNKTADVSRAVRWSATPPRRGSSTHVPVFVDHHAVGPEHIDKRNAGRPVPQ